MTFEGYEGGNEKRNAYIYHVDSLLIFLLMLCLFHFLVFMLLIYSFWA